MAAPLVCELPAWLSLEVLLLCPGGELCSGVVGEQQLCLKQTLWVMSVGLQSL